METLLQDLRYGVRMLVKSAGFTGVAVLTLALGIGLNTVIFSLVYALLLRPLPVRDPSQLVSVYQTRNGLGYRSLSLADYVYYRNHNHVFSDLAAHYSSAPINLVTPGESKEINGSVATANYFDLLGLRPFLGRFFLAEEDQVPGRNPVAVISYGLWQRQFETEPTILGKSIRLNGTAFTVIGVAPKDFHGVVLGGLATDVWIPSAMFRVGYRYCDALVERDCRVVDLIGRLKPGRTLADAQAEMKVLAQQLETAYPATNKGTGVILTPARGASPDERADSARTTTLLAAAVGLVLLIACANLAGLLLARSTARRKEIAVRLALGASRGRLLRQLLTESLILSLLGGTLGLLVAFWARDLLLTFYAVNDEGQRAYFNLGLDPVVLLCTLGLSLLTGFVFGLIPALQATRPDLIPALKDEGPSAGPRPSRLRDVLVVAQVALSIVLLVGAGLMIRSLRSIYRGPGFDPGRVVLLRLRPGLVAYPAPKGQVFQREAIRRIEALPGVLAASPAAHPALPGWGSNSMPVWLPGQEPRKPETGFRAGYNVVGPRYFETLGVPLIQGRDFNDGDQKGTTGVIVVNETLAHQFWPGGEALGRPLVVDGATYQVVGVVANFQYRSVEERPEPFVYLDYWQQDTTNKWAGESRTHVRVLGDPQQMLARIRKEIAAIDPDVPVSEDRPLTEWLDYSFRPVRIASTMLVCFGALAIFLSAIGLYGVLAFTVSQRTREMAIRMALGAERSDVAGLIVRQGALLAACGTGIGLLAAFASARFLAGFLYGVHQYDPITFLAAPIVLFGVALLASYLPARRAMRVDPMVALRYE